MKYSSVLKTASTTFLLVCFTSLKESTCEIWKNVFYFTSKALFVSRKSNFIILDIQISWRHQILKHKTRNNILLNNLGSKHSLLIKFGQFMSYYKREKFIKKYYKNCDLKTSSRPFCVCKELSITSNWKMKSFKQAFYTRSVLAKLSKFVQISSLTSSDCFFQRIMWKRKFFDKKFSSVILQTGQMSLPDCVPLKLFSKMCFVFHA